MYKYKISFHYAGNDYEKEFDVIHELPTDIKSEPFINKIIEDVLDENGRTNNAKTNDVVLYKYDVHTNSWVVVIALQ